MAVKVKERPEGSGVYWIYIDHQGKRKAKKIGRDKRLAQDVAKQIEAKLVLGQMNLTKKEERQIPFKEYSDKWITITVPAVCKRSTLKDYEGILRNYVLPVFGTMPINKINRLMVKEYLMKKLNDGLSPSSVNHMKNVLSGIFNLAVDDQIIMVNPAHRLGKLIKPMNRKLRSEPLTREELSTLLESFRRHFPRHYPMALLLARTGMRVGEAMALQWGDIDFNGRFLSIERGFSRGRIETPKNGKTRRVDMSKQLTEVLYNLKAERKKQTLERGWKRVPDWVFINDEGNPIDKDNWKGRVFDKALEKAQLRRIRVHDLRHTFASLLIQAGESLPYIRDQLGHHSIRVTVDIYGHLAPGGNKEAVDRLDDDATIRNLYATKKSKGAIQNR